MNLFHLHYKNIFWLVCIRLNFGDNNALISNTTTQEVQGATTDVNSFFNNGGLSSDDEEVLYLKTTRIKRGTSLINEDL